MKGQERFEEASRQFLQALQDAWAPADVQARGTVAYYQYMQVLQEASWSDVQQRIFQAYARYAQVVQDALQRQNIQQRTAEAYLNYIRAMQEAWTQIPIDSIDTESLAVIGQSILATAWVAALADGAPVIPSAPAPTSFT